LAIDLATQFSPHVDEEFATESKKSLVSNNDYSWSGAHSIKVYTVSTSEMRDYDRHGTGESWNRFGPVKDLDATTTELTLSRDRSFVFCIDKMDCDETKQALEAASALARQIRQVCIPEIDKYTFEKIAEGAGTKPAAVALTAENIYGEIIKASAALDTAECPEGGRVLIVPPLIYAAMKESPLITLDTDIGQEQRMKGVIAMLDGAAIVRVPAPRLPANTGFIMCHPVACVSPVKLQDFRAHRDPPGLSGDLVEGRLVYDSFVLPNKAGGIYFQALPAAAGG